MIHSALRQAEPNIQFVPNVIWNEKRVRALHSTVHFRPVNETFHEFLMRLVQMTFGVTWWKQQIRTPIEHRHVAVKWKRSFSKKTQVAKLPENWDSSKNCFVSTPSGPAWALLSLGWDIYCLRARNKLPEFLIERMRSNAKFHGARYEVAAAAIMERSGFDVEFLDDAQISVKHCELIATHRRTKKQIAIEAKTRSRCGSYHSKVGRECGDDWQGLRKLLKKAKDQQPGNLPFLIFLDVNAPSRPDLTPFERPWAVDLKEAIRQIRKNPSPADPDQFSLIVATNFAFHYGDEEDVCPGGEYILVRPNYTDLPIDDESLAEVLSTIERYDRIPAEI